MKTDLIFEFKVDKVSRTIHITKAFDAPLDLVWSAFTNADLLDQWCAPNPYRIQTKTMNFIEGGFWHYALVSPEGNKHWSRYDYTKIETHKTFTEHRAFSDENGIVSSSIKPTECTLIFSETEGKTLVSMTEKYESEDMFEKKSSITHQKGFSSHLKNLDKLLSTIKSHKI